VLQSVQNRGKGTDLARKEFTEVLMAKLSDYFKVTSLLVFPLFLFISCATGVNGLEQPTQTNGEADGGATKEVQIVCNGEVVNVLPTDMANCSFIDSAGSVVTGDVYIGGEKWDGRVPCPADDLVIEIYESASESVGKDVQKTPIASMEGVSIRGGMETLDTYAISASFSDDVSSSALVSTDECTCRIFAVNLVSTEGEEDPPPADAEGSLSALKGSLRTTIDGPVTKTPKGNYCDIGENGLATCSEEISLITNDLANILEVRTVANNGQDATVLLLAAADAYKFDTSFTAPVALDLETGKVNLENDMRGVAGTADIKVASDGTMHTITSLSNIVSRYDTNQMISYCKSVDNGVSYECEEIDSWSGVLADYNNTNLGRYPLININEDTGAVITTYLSGTDEALSLFVAIGPGGFQTLQIAEDVSKYKTFYVPSTNLLHIVWSEGSNQHDSPLQVHYTLVNLDSLSITSEINVSNLSGANYKADNPQVVVDSRSNIYVAYGVRYYNIIGYEDPEDSIPILKDAPTGTTGIVFSKINGDGTVTELQRTATGWTDDDAPAVSISIDSFDRVFGVYSAFDATQKLIVIQ
jgi:hypothetical protein